MFGKESERIASLDFRRCSQETYRRRVGGGSRWRISRHLVRVPVLGPFFVHQTHFVCEVVSGPRGHRSGVPLLCSGPLWPFPSLDGEFVARTVFFPSFALPSCRNRDGPRGVGRSHEPSLYAETRHSPSSVKRGKSSRSAYGQSY